MIRQLFGLVTLIAVCSAVASAQTIYVDGSNPSCPGSGTLADPYCKIQDAVDAASDGDTIEIAPGTYTEGIDANLSLESITIIGRDGAEATILSPPSSKKGVRVVNGTVVIEGLTVRDGRHGVLQQRCDSARLPAPEQQGRSRPQRKSRRDLM